MRAGLLWFSKEDETLVEVEANASNAFGEEMSPSAFRKWMRVTSKQPAHKQEQATLIVVKPVDQLSYKSYWFYLRRPSSSTLSPGSCP